MWAPRRRYRMGPIMCADTPRRPEQRATGEKCKDIGRQAAGSTIDSADEWQSSRAAGELTGGGERYRLKWWPSSDTTAIALFRVRDRDGGETSVIELQHVWKIYTRQLGQSKADIDPQAGYEDIPTPLLALLLGTGLEPDTAVFEPLRRGS